MSDLLLCGPPISGVLSLQDLSKVLNSNFYLPRSERLLTLLGHCFLPALSAVLRNSVNAPGEKAMEKFSITMYFSSPWDPNPLCPHWLGCSPVPSNRLCDFCLVLFFQLFLVFVLLLSFGFIFLSATDIPNSYRSVGLIQATKS